MSNKSSFGVVGCVLALVGIPLAFACCGGVIFLAMPRTPSEQAAAPPSSSTAKQEKQQPAADDRDDLTHFVARYGEPDEDRTSAYDNPRPLIPSRILTYKSERVRALYVPKNAEGNPKSWLWKLAGFTDPVAEVAITPEEVVRRMAGRERQR